MNISVNKIDRDKWLTFFKKNEYATPFQSPEFFDFINGIQGYEAYVYTAEDANDIKAICVVTIQKEKGAKGYFSRRAIIYGGPLVEKSEDKPLIILLEALQKELKGKAIYIEVRNLNDYSQYKDCFIEAGWSFDPHLNYHLDCSSENVVWSNLNNNRKRQIKKAISNGVEFTEANSIEEIKEYYLILSDLYKNKIKKPLFPYGFFEKFFLQKMGKFLLVKFQSKVIGGIVCPILDGDTIYEFYICGLDQEYKELSPSVMATYAAIEYGFNNGLRRFDFMGAGKPDEDYGVRDFKAKFGGELVEHGRFIKVVNPFLYKVGKQGLELLKKIKK